MIQEIVKQWEENKHKLEIYFKTNTADKFDSYEAIVKLIFRLCIPVSTDDNGWALDQMRVIDDGEYQGTQIFIIHKDTYQPDIDDYVITHTYYGSCSGCDTLLHLTDGYSDFPTEQQVKGYMKLALHLVQKLKWLDT